MSIDEKDFFPRFCDTPPLAFIKGSAEKIGEEQGSRVPLDILEKYIG
mgnify:CR=1 FL=1